MVVGLKGVEGEHGVEGQHEVGRLLDVQGLHWVKG